MDMLCPMRESLLDNFRQIGMLLSSAAVYALRAMRHADEMPMPPRVTVRESMTHA